MDMFVVPGRCFMQLLRAEWDVGSVRGLRLKILGAIGPKPSNPLP